jgi:hypothetical protein
MLIGIIRDIYTRSLTLDGNFSAQQLKSKRPEDDVPLTDGDGYTAQITRYREHLDQCEKDTKKYKEVSSPVNIFDNY